MYGSKDNPIKFDPGYKRVETPVGVGYEATNDLPGKVEEMEHVGVSDLLCRVGSDWYFVEWPRPNNVSD